MRKISIALVSGLAISLFSGCAALASSSSYVSAGQLKSIKKGAEQSDVLAALGQPKKTQQADGKSVLVYEINDTLEGGSYPVLVYLDSEGHFSRYEERPY